MNKEQMKAEFEDFRIRFGKAEGIKPNEDDAILLRKISWFLEASQAKSEHVGYYIEDSEGGRKLLDKNEGDFNRKEYEKGGFTLNPVYALKEQP